jgi:alkylresorcinol/alkylpyrone synthase
MKEESVNQVRKQAIDRPTVWGIGTALPPFRYSQIEIFERFLEPHFGRNRRARAIFNHAGVAYRYTAVQGSYYDQERTTEERNNCYVSQALPLGEAAIRRCLEQAGLAPEDITDFLVVSCTGLDIPGLDLRLAGQLEMSSDLRRTCVLGMGCYGAFPALVRAADAVTARPDGIALVLALELCSLHLQFDDTLENIVASALFADGDRDQPPRPSPCGPTITRPAITLPHARRCRDVLRLQDL